MWHKVLMLIKTYLDMTPYILTSTKILEKNVSSIFHLEDGRNKFIRNTSTYQTTGITSYDTVILELASTEHKVTSDKHT